MMVASCKRLPVSETFTNIGVLRFDLTSCRPLDQAVTPPIANVEIQHTYPIKGI